MNEPDLDANNMEMANAENEMDPTMEGHINIENEIEDQAEGEEGEMEEPVEQSAPSSIKSKLNFIIFYSTHYLQASQSTEPSKNSKQVLTSLRKHPTKKSMISRI